MSNPRFVIVIPTYWSWERGKKSLPEDSIFDHPTPVDIDGTLPRTLESFKNLQDKDFCVVLITAPVNPKLTEKVEKKIEGFVKEYAKEYPITQFGPTDLQHAQKLMKDKGIDYSIVGLSTYAEIRNSQLLASILTGATFSAAIDDDEIVPPEYLNKASEFIGKTKDGKGIDGVAGIYLNKNGDYRLKEPPEARTSKNLFDRKSALMNDEFSKYMESGDRLQETAIALGGNMVFTRELMMNVPFDPLITRGEDIDYLINSKLFGFNWFLDRELYITHLPPKPYYEDQINTSPYAKLQRDIIRFIYQKEKLKLSKTRKDVAEIKARDMGFYPGEFLKDGIEQHALEALRKNRPKDADERFFPKPEKLIEEAMERAKKAYTFLHFTEKWRNNIQKIVELKELSDYIREKLKL